MRRYPLPPPRACAAAARTCASLGLERPDLELKFILNLELRVVSPTPLLDLLLVCKLLLLPGGSARAAADEQKNPSSNLYTLHLFINFKHN